MNDGHPARNGHDSNHRYGADPVEDDFGLCDLLRSHNVYVVLSWLCQRCV
jgi:hypothetical protein